MKHILSLVLVLALTLSLFAVCVSAEETKTSLIPAEGATWTLTENGGANVTVEYNDSAVVFSGSVSGTWPCTESWYTDAPIVADVEDDYLSIDLKIEGGTTNINFFFEDSADSTKSYSFTICNTALGVEEGKYDTGSGDLYDAEYKLNLKISDLVASNKLHVPQGAEKGDAFPAGAIVDGQVKFIGIQVYSVNGAVVTINDLSVVNVTEDAPATSEDDAESSEEAVESSEEAVESSDAPATSSEAPKTGDAGILVFAVLAVVAIAGCAVAVKVRG